MKYKSLVRDKKTKELVIIESGYESKKDFIRDLRRNGYAVNRNKVKKTKEFDFIMNNTNCSPEDWNNKNHTA